MLSPLSILFLFVLGSLFYTLYLRVFSKQSPIIPTVILLLILIATFLFLPSIWKSLYNQTLSIYRLYSTLVFYPFSINTAIQPMPLSFMDLVLTAFSIHACSFRFSDSRICRWPHLRCFFIDCLVNSMLAPPCSPTIHDLCFNDMDLLTVIASISISKIVFDVRFFPAVDVLSTDPIAFYISKRNHLAI